MCIKLTVAKLSQNRPIQENRVPSLLAGAREGDFNKVDRLVRLQGVPVDAQEYEVRFVYRGCLFKTVPHILSLSVEYTHCSDVCGRFWQCGCHRVFGGSWCRREQM